MSGFYLRTKVFLCLCIHWARLSVLMNKFSSFSVSDHYDLVVIGGGSGGLACSKEGQLTIKSFLPIWEYSYGRFTDCVIKIIILDNNQVIIKCCLSSLQTENKTCEIKQLYCNHRNSELTNNKCMLSAASLGKRVAVLDYVEPSPQGWLLHIL